MKKLITAALSLFIAISALSQEKEAQLKFHSFKEASKESGTNLASQMMSDWRMASTGDVEAALIRVSFENISIAEAEQLKFNAPTNYCQTDISHLKQRNEVWLWLDPKDGTYITVQSPHSESGQYTVPVKLESKCVYDIVLKSDVKVPIFIITEPEGAVVRLETGQKATTPEPIQDVAYGKHTLRIYLGGQLKKTETIEVSKESVKFGPYDLRPTKLVKFTSDPSGAQIKINGEVRGETPVELNLPYDSYHVEAILSPTEIDTKDFTVDNLSANEIKLEPIKKKTFEVFASYGGQKVPAYLDINNKRQNTTSQSSYTLTLPIGKKYNMKMTYGAESKSRKIKIREDMNTSQEFKISAKNSIVWPWQREYDSDVAGVSAGYVQKQLVTKGEGEQLKENGIWDDSEGKWLSGMQFGFHFQPCFSWGLGVYSGLFYEVYFSWNDTYDYDTFVEHCLYMPVHAYYRIPFSKKIALSVHGGLGLNYSVHGAFSASDYEGAEDITDFYGQQGYPKRFNMGLEIGIGFRVGPVLINAQYSKGLNNHGSYESFGDFKTIQNKMSISASYVISAGE